MEIQVELKRVYGNEMIYPDCEKSRLLAKLTGNKTLTRDAIETIKSLGYKINVKQAPLSL